VRAVLLLVPGLLASWSFAAAMNVQINFAKFELAAMQILKPALVAMSNSAAGKPGGSRACAGRGAAQPGAGPGGGDCRQ
jgi:hypothetical protein